MERKHNDVADMLAYLKEVQHLIEERCGKGTGVRNTRAYVTINLVEQNIGLHVSAPGERIPAINCQWDETEFHVDELDRVVGPWIVELMKTPPIPTHEQIGLTLGIEPPVSVSPEP